MNDIISFVFGIPKEKDVLSKNSFFNGVSNIKSIKENNEEIKISFSTDFVFDDDVISTLQNIYKDDNGLYTFQQSNRSESKVVKIGQKILLSENRLLEKCSDGSIYKAKEYSIKNNTIAYVDKNGVLHGATILAKLKLYDTVVFGYDYKSIAEYIL